MPNPDDKVVPAQPTATKPLETTDGKTATATATQTQLDQTSTTSRLQSDTGRPGDKPAGEPYDSPTEALKVATGLENVPSNGRDVQTKLGEAMTATYKAEGSSPGQQVEYTGANGEKITGGEFVNKDGRFFRTAENETYKVEGKPGGGYTLTEVDAAGKPKPDTPPFDASTKGRADSAVNGTKPEPMSKSEPIPRTAEQPPAKPENPTPGKPQEINSDAQARADAARARVAEAQQIANQKPDSKPPTVEGQEKQNVANARTEQVVANQQGTGSGLRPDQVGSGDKPVPQQQASNADAQARLDAARARAQQSDQTGNPTTGGTKTGEGTGGGTNPGGAVGGKPTDVTTTGGGAGGKAGDANYQQGVAAANEIAARRDAARGNLAGGTDLTGGKPVVTDGKPVVTDGKPAGVTPGTVTDGRPVTPAQQPGKTEVTTPGVAPRTDANYQQGVAQANEIAARRDAARNLAGTTDGGVKPPTDVTTGKPKPDVVPANQLTSQVPGRDAVPAGTTQVKPDATVGTGTPTGKPVESVVTAPGGKPVTGIPGAGGETPVDGRSQRAIEAQQRVAEAQARIGGKTDAPLVQGTQGQPGGPKPEGTIANPNPSTGTGQGKGSEQYQAGVNAAEAITARREQARQQNADASLTSNLTSNPGDKGGAKGPVGDVTPGTKGATTDATTQGQPGGSQYSNFRQSIAQNPDLASQYDKLSPQAQRDMQRSFSGLNADQQAQALRDPSRYIQAAQEGKDLKTVVPQQPTIKDSAIQPVSKPETVTPTKPEPAVTRTEGTGLASKPQDGLTTGRPVEAAPIRPVDGVVRPQPDAVKPGQDPTKGGDARPSGGGNEGNANRDRAIENYTRSLNLSDQDKARLSQLPPDKQYDVLRASMQDARGSKAERNEAFQAQIAKIDAPAKPGEVSPGPKPQVQDTAVSVKPQNPDLGKPQVPDAVKPGDGGKAQPAQPGEPRVDRGTVPQLGDKGQPQPGVDRAQPGVDRGQPGVDRGQQGGDKGGQPAIDRNERRAEVLIARNLPQDQRAEFLDKLAKTPQGEGRDALVSRAMEQANQNREARGKDPIDFTQRGVELRAADARGVDGKAIDIRQPLDKGGDRGDRGGDAQSKLPPELAKNYLDLKAAVSKGEMSAEQAQKQWKQTLESFTQNPDNRQLLEQIRQQRQDQQKDGGKDGIVLQGRVEAQQQRQEQQQQQRNEIVLKTLGLDANNKDNREFLNEALKRLDALKLNDVKDLKLQDVLKGLDPSKVAKLEALLNLDNKPGAKPLDANAVTALKDVLNAVNKAPDKMATPADIANAQKTAVERVLDALRAKPEQVSTGVLQTKDGKGVLPELVKTMDAIVQNTGKQMSVADLVVRAMDTRVPGAADSRSIFDSRTESLTTRLNPAQEQAIKNLAEVKAQTQAAQDATRGGALDPAGRRPDAIKLDVNPTGRPGEVAGGRPGDILVGKPGEGIGPAIGQRADVAGVKTDGLVPGAGKIDVPGAVKADITPGIKPEAGVVKGDVPGISRIDPTTGKPFDSTAATTHGALGERGDKADPMLAELRAQKERDDKLKAEKEKEEKEKKDKELTEEELNQQRALLALMAARKLKEEKEKEEKEKAEEKDKKKDDDTRRRYVVKQGDTLDKIASRECRDVRLSALIYEINREVIALKEEKGKKVVDLKPKTVLWLPSEADIKEFRGRLFGASKAPDAAAGGGVRPDGKPMSAEEELAARFGENWDGKEANAGSDADSVAGDLMHGAVAAAQNRRANIEKLLGPVAKKGSPDGRINYIVRLGDSLKSVASKHPALKDVHLWKLLAEVNGISTQADSRGNPTTSLTRGSTIVIPSPDEIEKFREASGKRPAVLSQSSAETKVEKVAKSCSACGRMAVLSATICPACTAPFEQPDSDKTPDAASVMLQAMGSLPKKQPRRPYVQDATTEPLSDEAPRTIAVTGPPAEDGSVPKPTPEYEQPVVARPPVEQIDRFIKSLGEASRLVKSSENWSTAGGRFREQLEVLRGASWEAVVSYEIYEDVSLRHEHTPDGRRKTVRIDLPPMAAQELADNDLFQNWQSYCKRYMAQFLET